MNKKLSGIVAFSLVASMALAACGSDSSEPSKPTEAASEPTTAASVPMESTAAESSSFPIVIKHALGETVSESKPERVAAIGSRNEDTLLALGVVPVGITMNTVGVRDDSGLLPWVQDALAELGAETTVYSNVDGIDYEAISASEPDLILATYSDLTPEQYELLSEIAPVVAYPKKAWLTDWRSTTLTNARAIGMEEEGKELVADLEALLAEESAKYPAIAGKTAAYFRINVTDLSSITVYLPDDSRMGYLLDYGFELPQSVIELGKTTEAFAQAVSAENIEMFEDVDVMIIYGDEATLEALQNDKLLSNIPAIQRGSVALVPFGSEMQAASLPSALAIPAHAADFAAMFGEAAAKCE